MKSKDQLIEEFSGLIPFLESLRGIDEGVWAAPIGDGKWSIRDIVSHVMLWDEYFLREAVDRVVDGKPITVQHLNFDEFNRRAMAYGEATPRDKLIQEAVACRRRIIHHLTQIPQEEYTTAFAGPDGKFVIQDYIRDFVDHDTWHMGQVQTFLKSTE